MDTLKHTASSAAPAVEETTEGFRPTLIEGRHTADRELRITLPTGAVWLYDFPLPPRIVVAASGRETTVPDMLSARALLVCVDLASPRVATVFQPSAEGIHPFLGLATRIGVERNPRA